ncbi:putative BAH domain-containing protein [Helianthus debilis subsp. tardiflorus]
MEKVNEDVKLDFKWLKQRGVGGKNKKTRFYESFEYDGVEYMQYDCVYMYKDDSHEPNIGKLTKIWEHPDKSKKVKVHWFFRPEEISHWLRETKTLENEVFLASGEGRGLANINPLEAIAGRCNVVCISKDVRNPQPSDEELKAVDFVFNRTFDVQSCTVLDKMDDKVGGLEIEYIFNRKKGDTKEEIPNTIISTEAQITKTVDPQDNDVSSSLKRNAESDESHDRPLKRIKSNDKCVESAVASGPEKMTELPSFKSKVDKDKMQVNIVPVEKIENKERIKTPTGSDKLHDQPSKKVKSVGKKPLEEKSVQLKVIQPAADSKSKQEDKVPADVNNLKTTAENQKNGSFKVPDNKKPWTYMNEKDSVTNSASPKGKSKSGSLDSPGDNNNIMAVKEEQSCEMKRKLSMNKPLKASALSTDKDKYKPFVVTPRPNFEKSTWFRQAPWEERLKEAYDKGTAILLHNLKPDYTSEDVKNIIWHAFKEIDCSVKILPRTAISSPHYDQALVLLKTKEAAQRILTELDEGCLMLSDERPLVGTPCPPISTKKYLTFFGHLAVDKARFQNQREDEAVSTSHFSQPNTIEYDMAMEWCLQQLKSKKWWAKFHKQQGLELKKLEKDLKQKRT